MEEKPQQQTKLEVGAGLQEGRINEEFKDFLERWSLPVLAVIAVLVAIYSGSKYYDTWQDDRRDAAFVTLEEVRGNIGIDGLREGSPDALIKVADELEGRGAAALIARLDAADIYLGAVRRGIAPGTNLEDFSNDAYVEGERAETMLATAEAQYRRVADRTRRNDDRMPMFIRAMMGLASVEMTKGDADAARQILDDLAQRADAAGFGAYAEFARQRLENVEQWSEPIALLSTRDIDPVLNDPTAIRVGDDTVELKPIDPMDVPEHIRNNPNIYPESSRPNDVPQEGEPDPNAADSDPTADPPAEPEQPAEDADPPAEPN